MKTVAEKRAYFMTYMIGVFDRLDPSGENTKLFKQDWEPLSDAQFNKRAEAFFADEKANFYLEIVEFERDLSLDNVIQCADYMNIPLCEYAAVPHINGSADENVVVTPYPVPIGYIHGKRQQQTLLKKNTGSLSNRKRNPKTDQVVNQDKNARNSNVETYSMIASGAEMALREFLGPRADDSVARNQMERMIRDDGYATLADLDIEPQNKRSLNSLDAYFHMQGFTTNLIFPTDVITGGE